jgi:feruloyl-CoA hydratase/lyase
MEFQTIKVEENDGVMTIAFNRPEKKNCMSPQMHQEMNDILDRAAYDDGVRVVVLTGTGESFCAGQDLKEYFYNLNDTPTEKARVAKLAEWRAHRLRLLPKPTIAAVNGWCFGGAFTIVANCDIAIAAEESVFGLSEVNFGKFPGGHVTKAVATHFHPRDALYYIFTGRTFTGIEAAKLKFVNFAVPLAKLPDTVNELANELKSKNPHVLRAAKEAFKYSTDMNWEEAGNYFTAKSKELDLLTGTTWKKGVDQFKKKEYRPGLGGYDWKKDDKQ